MGALIGSLLYFVFIFIMYLAGYNITKCGSVANGILIVCGLFGVCWFFLWVGHKIVGD